MGKHGIGQRVVVPELLDELPGDDPKARRSRRDLRLINFLMGNERWIERQLAEESRQIIELGAGDGILTGKLGATGLDLQPQPEGQMLNWIQGDLFETLPQTTAPVVVANLILHHFEDKQLAELGHLLREREKFVIVEPWRSWVSLSEGKLLFPFINEVTRHDMMVSIRAGFQRGELERLLNLGSEWQWQEDISLLGGIRVLAWRE